MHGLFKEKGIKMSPDDAWYLQLIFTDPEYQGKGNIFCNFLTGQTSTENSMFFGRDDVPAHARSLHSFT